MDTHLLAYLAGIIDGEASMGNHSRGKGKGLRFTINVNMTDERTVRLLYETFGGSFYSKPAANDRCKPQFVWRVTAIKADQTYDLLEPYLRLKRKD